MILGTRNKTSFFPYEGFLVLSKSPTVANLSYLPGSPASAGF
jgi:hypothetical protein